MWLGQDFFLQDSLKEDSGGHSIDLSLLTASFELWVGELVAEEHSMARLTCVYEINSCWSRERERVYLYV